MQFLLEIKAEHLVLLFFFSKGLQFPQNPSALGTPIELPHPKIINFIILINKKFIKIIRGDFN